MSVDYSSHNFKESRAIIDAASRDNATVRHHGDVTVITEYRDPYSFYWQLDQARPKEEEPQKCVEIFSVPHINFLPSMLFAARFSGTVNTVGNFSDVCISK